MPNIRPSSEIRNNYQELSRLVKETKEPIYLTVNGKGDVALIDIATLDELYRRVELYKKISEGIEEIERGDVIGHQELFSKFQG